MKLLVWLIAAVLLWVVGAIGSLRSSPRSGRWFLIGALGLGLCCAFLGALTLEEPPLGRPFWTRLLWSTLVVIVPVSVTFSYRFGRPESGLGANVEKLALFVLWTASLVLLVVGLTRSPMEWARNEHDAWVLVLKPPVGRYIVIEGLLGAVLILWNLQATLEAARAASRRHLARSIYALIPVIVTGIYLLAELLLYGQQSAATLDVLVAAAILSAVAFPAALGRPRMGEETLPDRQPVAYSSVLLTALGAFFMGLAVLAEVFQRLGIAHTQTRWYEQVGVWVLVLVFSLWAFPGLRGEIGRFLSRSFSPQADYRSAWERVNRKLGMVRGPSDLLPALRGLLRDMFGPLRVQLWMRDACGVLVPADGTATALPRFEDGHPLRAALESSPHVLLVTGEARRMDEIPLQVACEELHQAHGLRVFFPIRSGDMLAGILACGPGGGRTIHPEDFELLQVIADHLAGIIAPWTGAGSSTHQQQRNASFARTGTHQA